MSSKSETSEPKTSGDLAGLRPRKDKEREMLAAIAEDADNIEGADHDLVHGDGGAVGLPTDPGDLNHDD
jgi:hypothetical protein